MITMYGKRIASINNCYFTARFKVTINGEKIFIESNNTFLEMLDVPISGLEVRVVASNEGRKVESIKFKIKVK